MSKHEQFADDLALYAAGTLTSEERAAMEKHLEGCATCRGELDRLRGDAALLLLSAADAKPPAHARKRLMSAIAAEPRGRRAPQPVSSKHDWWTVGWAWAASIAAGALLAWSLGLRRQGHDMRQAIAGLEQLFSQQQQQLDQTKSLLAMLSDTSAARFNLTAAGAPKQPEGRAIYAGQRHGLIFLAYNLPSLPPQKAYELWLIPQSGAPIPAGVFKPDARGSASIINTPPQPLLPSGEEPKAFAVTVEPESGSAAPTSQPIMSGSGA